MNIKALIADVIKGAQHLALVSFGMSGSPESPTAESGASVARKLSIADADSPISIACNVAPENQPAPAAKRRRRKQAINEVAVIPLEQRKWLSIKETSARYPCFSEKSLRHLVMQAEAYAKYPKEGLRSNGLIGCIIRPAGQRKIVIDAEKFEQWLRDHAVRAGE